MYNEKIQCYNLKDFLIAIYGECLESEDPTVEYGHCELWINNKSIQLHICDGED